MGEYCSMQVSEPDLQHSPGFPKDAIEDYRLRTRRVGLALRKTRLRHFDDTCVPLLERRPAMP